MSLMAYAARLSPFGPIFGKELRITARRKRSYMLRVVYLGLLLLALLVGWAAQGRSYGGLAAQAQRQSELGSIFFAVFSMFCIIMMGLIGPVLTATAIGSERLAKTLPLLLMTPINTWQIIGGKLFSRLLTAITLLGLSLPVLALVRLLGGVELIQMEAVLCLCISFAMGCAAIGLFYSSLMNRAYAVILLSYATLGFVYMLLPLLLVGIFAPNSGPNSIWLPIITAINPIMTTAFQLQPPMRQILGNGWLAAVGVQLGLTAILVLLSGLLLRRSARTAGEQVAAVNFPDDAPLAAPTRAPLTMTNIDSWQLPDGAVLISPPPSPAPPSVMDYAPARIKPGMAVRVSQVSDNPILWRETRQPLMRRKWQRIVSSVVLLVLMLLIYSTLALNSALDEPDCHIAFAIIFAGIVWIITAVLSATAIAGEKESDTWTLLLAAPMSGTGIIRGKVVGLLRRMLWPIGLVAAHFTLFALLGKIDFRSILLVLWVIVTFNSIWIATGIYLSLRMRRVTFAVVTNLMLAVLVYLLPMIFLVTLAHAADINDDIAINGWWHVPYWYLGAGLHGLNTGYATSVYPRPVSALPFELPTRYANVTGGIFSAILFAIGSAHLLMAALILRRTAVNFDRIVGRAEH